jgi:hypothetical protein
MIYVIRYTMIAVLCSVVFVPSVSAKDADFPQDNRRIKESDIQAGLKTIRGRIVRSENGSLTVKQVNDKETVLKIDPQTRTNHNFYPGDRITATVTREGRAVVVEKEGKPEP